MSTLEVQGVVKGYSGRQAPALRGVSLCVPAGGYTCVVGASGSGKTTLLRVVAGLERPDAGAVWLEGQRLEGLPAERRPVCSVFQGYALFPHLTVAENVAFPLRVAGQAPGGRVEELLAAVELSGYGPRAVHTLSGGEQQRVALARALVARPRMVLLDEPLAALDRPLRHAMRRLLRGLHATTGVGVLHVTHDPEEALGQADTLVVLERGRVLAQGTPEALYARPPDLRTARLLGELTPLPDGSPGSLRPERLRLVPAGGVPVRVERVVCLGDRWELELHAAAGPCHLRTHVPPGVARGATVHVGWDGADVLRLEEPCTD